MNCFTFVILTYNQEKYIIEHLESIKYQIDNYGSDIRISLLVCDDCSTDNTINFAKKWINNHSNLFSDVNYIVANKNMGTVSNYLSALNNVKTDRFKLLAGDDLYYKNNIFKLIDIDSNFIITPIIRFCDSKTIYKELKNEYYRYLMIKQKQLKRYLCNTIKYTMPFHTPGVFWRHSLFDKDMNIELQNYTLIEDIPTWNYLLNKDSLGPKYVSDPYILYRVNSGISHSSTKSMSYLLDMEHIRNDIWKKIYNNNKNINFHKWNYYLNKKINEKILSLTHTGKKANKNYYDEILMANEYLLKIKEQATIYEKNI